MTLEDRIREVLTELRRRQARLVSTRGASYYGTVHNDGQWAAYEDIADLLEAALAETQLAPVDPETQLQEMKG